MLLSELLGNGASGAGNVEVLGLTADSRAVKPGYLFAALRGGRADGVGFIGDAVAN
ncbi:MAG: UDP-N-acetylmuramoyl-L-alanyl-D-glutamate--2,6-diaminopimelate ligase, partial [Proteobacteria bacterium]|nr:UDP-N-acetylmuramoyl-L-alanyl-D-glutamate--2,6-diaminopimelate ligase [Pseudomonadota bacterium]